MLKTNFIALVFLTILSGQCAAEEYFEVAIIGEEIYLDGVKTPLESVEKIMQVSPRPAYLFSVAPNKVKYLSVMLYITKNSHELFLADKEDFSLVFSLDGKRVERKHEMHNKLVK